MKLTHEDLYNFYADVHNFRLMANQYFKENQAGMDEGDERLYRNLIYYMQELQDALKPLAYRYLNSIEEDE